MPACNSTSPPSPWRIRRGNLLGWMLTLLAGLAVGLWPQAVYRPHAGSEIIVLPVLGTLAVAQAGYMLLAWPLALWRGKRSFSADAAEASLMLLAALPLLIAGCYLSDATWADLLRVELLTAAMLPLAWSAGRGACSTGARSATSLLMLALTAALPAAWYIATELVPTAASDWLWQFGACTLTWSNAKAGGNWFPQPLWPVWLYLGAGVAWGGLILARPGGRVRPTRS